jgi:hypothetical protein
MKRDEVSGQKGGGGGAGYLGAAVARAQNVESLDIAVYDADQHVMQVGEGADSLTRCPDALIRGRRGFICQRVEPAAARHPLHDDEGVGLFQARAEYLNAVGVVDLRKLSAMLQAARRAVRTMRVARLEHGRHFLSELLQLARIESDFYFRSLDGGFSPVVERAQHNACDKMRSSIRHAMTRSV